MEMDDEVAGTGNSYTAPYWQYDPRIGRRWDQDPIEYAHQSPYATFNNNPVFFKDPLGLEGEGSNGGGDGPPSKEIETPAGNDATIPEDAEVKDGGKTIILANGDKAKWRGKNRGYVKVSGKGVGQQTTEVAAERPGFLEGIDPGPDVSNRKGPLMFSVVRLGGSAQANAGAGAKGLGVYFHDNDNYLYEETFFVLGDVSPTVGGGAGVSIEGGGGMYTGDPWENPMEAIQEAQTMGSSYWIFSTNAGVGKNVQFQSAGIGVGAGGKGGNVGLSGLSEYKAFNAQTLKDSLRTAKENLHGRWSSRSRKFLEEKKNQNNNSSKK